LVALGREGKGRKKKSDRLLEEPGRGVFLWKEPRFLGEEKEEGKICAEIGRLAR